MEKSEATLTLSNVAGKLRALGLEAGGTVLVHSSLSSLGHVEGGAAAVVDAFRDVLGPQGTLCVPTFGKLGVLTDEVRNRPGAVESLHPHARMAALGPAAEALCRDHWKAETAHGEGTPYHRLAERGGWVCLLGVDQDRSTLLHAVEALLRLPYLKTRGPTPVATPEGEVMRSWSFFPGPHRDFIGLDRVLRERGALRTGRIGNAEVRLMRAADLIRIGLELGRADPAFALCANPACADCVAQRGAILRARFETESFRLAAAASLAGRYVPEMIESCRAAGIERIEIDAVQGEPVSRCPVERLAAAVCALRAEGIEVCGLRLGAAGARVAEVLPKAVEAGVRRLVAPLTATAADDLAAAAGAGVRLAFVATGMDSAGAAAHLKGLARGDASPLAVFSPAAWVRAGEKPFLTSFRAGFRRLLDQLDIEDFRFDGSPAALGQGNGEIKELISILRCSHFDGLFVMSAENRSHGGLREAVAHFVALLDAM